VPSQSVLDAQAVDENTQDNQLINLKSIISEVRQFGQNSGEIVDVIDYWFSRTKEKVTCIVTLVQTRFFRILWSKKLPWPHCQRR
jgi:hypothetical protein